MTISSVNSHPSFSKGLASTLDKNILSMIAEFTPSSFYSMRLVNKQWQTIIFKYLIQNYEKERNLAPLVACFTPSQTAMTNDQYVRIANSIKREVFKRAQKFGITVDNSTEVEVQDLMKQVKNAEAPSLQSFFLQLYKSNYFYQIQPPKTSDQDEVTAASLTRDWMYENQKALKSIRSFYSSNIEPWFELSILPSEMVLLTNLEYLFITHTQIQELPPEIESFRVLKELDLSFNQIQKLPPEIGNLVALKTLDLRNNQLEELSDKICRLVSLTVLIVNFNKLQKVHSFLHLTSLEVLQLEGNQLHCLPWEDLSSLAKYARLNHLFLRLNHLGDSYSLPASVKVNFFPQKCHVSVVKPHKTDLTQISTCRFPIKFLSNHAIFLSNNRKTLLPFSIDLPVCFIVMLSEFEPNFLLSMYRVNKIWKYASCTVYERLFESYKKDPHLPSFMLFDPDFIDVPAADKRYIGKVIEIKNRVLKRAQGLGMDTSHSTLQDLAAEVQAIEIREFTRFFKTVYLSAQYYFSIEQRSAFNSYALKPKGDTDMDHLNYIENMRHWMRVHIQVIHRIDWRWLARSNPLALPPEAALLWSSSFPRNRIWA